LLPKIGLIPLPAADDTQASRVAVHKRSLGAFKFPLTDAEAVASPSGDIGNSGQPFLGMSLEEGCGCDRSSRASRGPGHRTGAYL